MMILKKCVVKLGVKIRPNYVLIRLTIKMKVNIISSMKAKTHILIAFVTVSLFDQHKCRLQLKIKKIWKH